MIARTTVPLIELVHDARQGCDRSTNELVQHCLPDLEGYLARRGSDIPEAMANQVMAEFVRALDRLQFDTDQQVWGYVHSIARSRLIDERRRARPEETRLEHVDVIDRHQSSFDERVANKMTVESMISDLTVEQREVIQMRFMEDLSIHETAHRLGKSITAVKGLQHRAIAALAAAAAIVLLLLAVSQLGAERGTYVEIEPTDPVGPDGDALPDNRGGDRNATLFAEDLADLADDDASLDDSPTANEITPDAPRVLPVSTTRPTPVEADELDQNETPGDQTQQLPPPDGNPGDDGANGETTSSPNIDQVATTTVPAPVTAPTSAPVTTMPITTPTTLPPTDGIGDVFDFTVTEQLELSISRILSEVAVPLGPSNATPPIDPNTFTVWDAPARGGLRFDPGADRPVLYFVLPSTANRLQDDYARYSICETDGVCHQTVLLITYTAN